MTVRPITPARGRRKSGHQAVWVRPQNRTGHRSFQADLQRPERILERGAAPLQNQGQVLPHAGRGRHGRPPYGDHPPFQSPPGALGRLPLQPHPDRTGRIQQPHPVHGPRGPGGRAGRKLVGGLFGHAAPEGPDRAGPGDIPGTRTWTKDGWPVVNGDHHVSLKMPAPSSNLLPWKRPR